MFIRVVDADGAARLLVDHIRLQERLTPPASTPFKNYTGVQNNVTLAARFSLVCGDNFYGSDCTDYCVSQDSTQLGHYTCSADGEKVCLSGYADPASNCTKCVTSDGCCKLMPYLSTRWN